MKKTEKQIDENILKERNGADYEPGLGVIPSLLYPINR